MLVLHVRDLLGGCRGHTEMRCKDADDDYKTRRKHGSATAFKQYEGVPKCGTTLIRGAYAPCRSDRHPAVHRPPVCDPWSRRPLTTHRSAENLPSRQRPHGVMRRLVRRLTPNLQPPGLITRLDSEESMMKMPSLSVIIGCQWENLKATVHLGWACLAFLGQ